MCLLGEYRDLTFRTSYALAFSLVPRTKVAAVFFRVNQFHFVLALTLLPFNKWFINRRELYK